MPPTNRPAVPKLGCSCQQQSRTYTFQKQETSFENYMSYDNNHDEKLMAKAKAPTSFFSLSIKFAFITHIKEGHGLYIERSFQQQTKVSSDSADFELRCKT